VNPLVVLSLGALAPRTPLREARRAAELDPVAAAALLRRHKVVRLAASRLDDGSAAKAALLPAVEQAAQRAEAARSLFGRLPELIGAAAARTGEKCEVAGMKGIACSLWYPEPILRDVSDLDLWVPDAAQAAALRATLTAEFGHTTADAELPWFKRAPDGTVYGVAMMKPTRDRLPHVDVHFGHYSVMHCASLPIPGGNGEGMLTDEHNLCCVVANAAGDHFVDVKGLNDLYLAVNRGLDWDHVLWSLRSVGLLGFLRVMTHRMTKLFDVVPPRELLTLPRWPEPALTAPDFAARCRATVRHAALLGMRRSPAHAARLAATAYRYYRRPLGLRQDERRAPKPFRVQPSAWTCTRMVPVPMVEPFASRHPAEVSAEARRPIVPGLAVLPTRYGDLVEFGGELFLPTVFYRIAPQHAAAAVRLGRPTGDQKGT
jgi:hypothetical protein